MYILSKVDISINQKPFTKYHRVSINQNLYGIDAFEITCRYDALEELDGFLIEKSKDFLGLPVVIRTKVKQKDEEKDGITFRGFITGVQSSRSGITDNDEITISGGSSEISLDREPTNRVFLDNTLEEIVKEVLKKYEFKFKISPRNKERYPYIVQFEESDLEFLKRLSARYGEWCFFNGLDFVFGEIAVVEKLLTIGYDLKTFNYELRVKPVKFNMETVDNLNREVHRYDSGSSKIESNLNMYGKHALKMSKKMYTEEGINYYEHVNVKESDYKKGLDRVGETKEIADAVNLTELSGVSNNGFLSAGMQVKISCLKQNKNEKQDYGKYLLTSVNHQMDSNFFYENVFTAIPAETSLPENTNPMIIRTSSNQQAYVTDNKDPDKLGRIKVRFWWMKRGQSTPWLKVLTPYSHLKAGIYFVPALNSRVLVGFEDDDVEKPYCLGTLYDEAVTPDPEWVGNANEGDAKIHAIRTASGNTIEFHDSGGGEKITLYDKDDKNRITLDSANRTLTIHADGTLNINATKINIKAEKEFTLICEKSDTTVTEDMNMTVGNNLSIDAGRNFSLASGSDNTVSAGKKLKREAAEVEISALGSLKSTAKGKAEFTATGITVIKGSLVQIN